MNRIHGRFVIGVIICALGIVGSPSSIEAQVPSIKVLKDDWGDAPLGNIEAVCRSVASELVPYFPKRKFEPITVSRSKGSPIVLYGAGAKGERRVSLNVKGTFWSQFAYQFGHEMGHILCNYRAAKNTNLWFEESLCETASIFAMRRMAKTWKEKPPYANWKPYAGSFETYADDTMRGVTKLDKETLPKWLQENEASLRKIDRPKIHAIGVHVLLPLLEKNPARWEALNWLNQFEAQKELSFAEYLADWHSRVPVAHKPFVADVASAFGLSLKNSK
ncbi:MAG: hypothetical protein EXS16_21610 [Gemmataceae bacterium]|nr:hypothetical protein [Gemmataceae bacterium]